MSKWVFSSDRHKHVFKLMAETGRKGVFVPFELIHLLGDYASAILLAQILFWSGVVNNRWFYKSATDWYDEIRISKSVLRRCLYGDQRAPNRIALTDIGVKTKTSQANGAPTTHYRVDYDELERALAQLTQTIVGLSDFPLSDNQTNDSAIIGRSITEKTTETTTQEPATQASPVPGKRGAVKLTPHQAMIQALLSAFGIDHAYATKNDFAKAAEVSKQLREIGMTADQIPMFVQFVRNQAQGQWTVTMTSLTTNGRAAQFLTAQRDRDVTKVTEDGPRMTMINYGLED